MSRDTRRNSDGPSRMRFRKNLLAAYKQHPPQYDHPIPPAPPLRHRSISSSFYNIAHSIPNPFPIIIFVLSVFALPAQLMIVVFKISNIVA